MHCWIKICCFQDVLFVGYLRFPPVLLRIYFEARLVGLSLKHNFHQFLNSNLFVRSSTWQDCEDKSHRMSSFSLPDVRREMVGRPRSTRKPRRSAHPYSLKIFRTCRTPSKFSYYRPPKWPYLKKVEHYEKKRGEYFKKNKGDYGSSGYQMAVTCSSQWSVAPHASQSFYQGQHSYYGQPYLAGHDFINSSPMGLSTFPMTHLQHSSNMGIVSTSHCHLQSGQWFDRVRSEQQSPVYVTSGFQGTITKLVLVVLCRLFETKILGSFFILFLIFLFENVWWSKDGPIQAWNLLDLNLSCMNSRIK